MPRIRWRSEVSFDSQSPILQTIVASIRNIQGPYAMQPYVAGDQQATTTVSWPPDEPETETFTTAGQMHSEMRAVATMLDEDAWTLQGHAIAEHVTSAEFTTDLPHCGWCTVMLAVLGLPIGTPTAGRYNFAANLEYPVPSQVRERPNVLFFLIDSAGGDDAAAVAMKGALDTCITTASDAWVLALPSGAYATDAAVVRNPPGGAEVLSWDDAMRHPIRVDLGIDRGEWAVLRMFWKLIFAGIYERTVS